MNLTKVIKSHSAGTKYFIVAKRAHFNGCIQDDVCIMIKQLLRQPRYFGNTLLTPTADIKFSGNRIIKLNASLLLESAQLYVFQNGLLYDLQEREGFLKLGSRSHYLSIKKMLCHSELKRLK